MSDAALAPIRKRLGETHLARCQCCMDLAAVLAAYDSLAKEIATPTVSIQCACCGARVDVPAALMPIDESGICPPCQVVIRKEIQP